MKVMFLSDWHLDNNQKFQKKNLLVEMIDYINEERPDYVIVAGDISGSSKTTLKVIDRIEEETAAKVKFVPGNHDIWTRKQTSWDNYEELKSHPSSLMHSSLELPNGYIVIGDQGWYDYSFRPSYMNRFEVKGHKENLWADADYAKWQMDDADVYKKMEDNFREMLEAHKDRKVIFVNHFIPYVDFLKFKQDESWNTCNAFMGSKHLGELLDAYPNVEYVVFGHTHHRFGQMEFGDKTVICNPLGYKGNFGNGEWDSADFKTEVKNTAIFLEF